jgi:hypothetical protein
MAATSTLSDVTMTACRAAEIHGRWMADPEMPDVAGSMADAVRVLAIRAAVHEATGDEDAAALPAPEGVELSGLLLNLQFPELRRIIERTCHRFIAGTAGTRWQSGDYTHQVYVGAFGAAGGRHWLV